MYWMNFTSHKILGLREITKAWKQRNFSSYGLVICVEHPKEVARRTSLYSRFYEGIKRLDQRSYTCIPKGIANKQLRLMVKGAKIRYPGNVPINLAFPLPKELSTTATEPSSKRATTSPVVGMSFS